MEQKIKNNAVSCYFGLWFLILIRKSKNEYINNSFVKNHAKTASLIHLWFLINYIVFINFWFLSNLWFFYSIDIRYIISTAIFLWLFWILIYWVYKSNIWETFSFSDVKKITKTEEFLKIDEIKLNEQWIFSMIFSLIPLFWFINRWKYYNYKSKMIENNIKLNLIFTLFVSVLFIFENNSLWYLFILFYAIFVVFYAILLISKSHIININLEYIPTAEEIFFNFLKMKIYLINYLKWKFTNLKDIDILLKNEMKEKQENNLKELNNFKENKIKPLFYYIPIINIINFLDINSKYRFHTINWLILTFISIPLVYFIWIEYMIFIFIIIFFSIWYLKKLNYKIFFLYDIFNIFFKIFINSKNKIKEKKEENVFSIKIND